MRCKMKGVSEMLEMKGTRAVERLWEETLIAYQELGESSLFRKMKWYEKLTVYFTPGILIVLMVTAISIISFDSSQKITVLCFEAVIILAFSFHMVVKEPLRVRYLNLERGANGIATTYEAFMERLRDRNIEVEQMRFVREHIELQRTNSDTALNSAFAGYISLMLFPALGVYFSKTLEDPLVIAAILLGTLLVPILFSLLHSIFSGNKIRRQSIHHLLSLGILDERVRQSTKDLL